MTVGTIATVTPFSYTRAGQVDGVRILHSQGSWFCAARIFARRWGTALFEYSV